jgi:hypothetical protein
MSEPKTPPKSTPQSETPAGTDGKSDGKPLPKEIGGRGGPEPTRYGDWEINGRCVDF